MQELVELTERVDHSARRYGMEINANKKIMVTPDGCQIWTISQASLNRIRAFKLRYLRKLLGIKYYHHRTNESVLQEVKNAIGPFTRLDSAVKHIKLPWDYRHSKEKQVVV